MYIYICISSSLQEDILFLLEERRASMQRRNVVDDRWKRERKEEVRGDESRMQRGMARQGYIGVKSEPASLERAAAGFKKLLLGGER